MNRQTLRIAVLGALLLVWPDLGLAEQKEISYPPEYALRGGEAMHSVMLNAGRIFELPVLRPEHYILDGLFTENRAGLALETLSFAAVERIFGPSPVINLDGVHGRMRCYVSDRPDDRTAVLLSPFISATVDEITILADKGQVKRLDMCRSSEAVHASLATKSGLRLGMTRVEVEALLGPPHGLRKNKLLYSAWDRDLSPAERRAIGMTDTSGKNMSLTRQVTLWLDKQGRVSAFSIYQGTSGEGW